MPTPLLPAAPARLLPLLVAAVLSGCGASEMAGVAPASPAGLARQASAEMAQAGGVSEEAPAAPGPAARPSASPAPDAAARSALGSVVGTSSRASGPASGSETREPNRGDAPAAMLIYTASVGMQTDESEVAPTLDAIIDVAYALGGYVASRTDTTVTVRIPSAQFRQGLRQVEQLGEVTGRSVSTEDVSEEFHDMEVRLQNLRALRQRLEQFFSRANSIQEALQVQAELERVAREIDQIEGRMRFLSSRAAFSIVTVNVTARPRPQPVQVHDTPPPPAPTPVRRIVQVPIEWLGRLGVGRLLDLATP